MTVAHRSREPIREDSAAHWLTSLLVPVLGLLILSIASKRPSVWMFWLLPALLFLVVPVLDGMVEKDERNPPLQPGPSPFSDFAHAAIPLLFVPFQWSVLLVALVVISNSGLSWLSFAGLVLTVGAVNGVGVGAAHEVGHRAGKLAAGAARMGLAPLLYGHFRVEHNRGHHRHVATANDPASARLGENYWHFLIRSVSHGWMSAWRLEKLRLQRQGRSSWSLANECIQSWIAISLLLATAWCIGRGEGLLFVVLQAAYAISLIEAINYIEHYGLKRQVVHGKLERCTPRHSWNCDSTVSNRLLFNLQRHSDHHANPVRRYQALRTDSGYPRLPIGYAGLIFVVYLPPLWFKIMDGRVLDWCGGELERANLHTAAAERLTKKFFGER